MRKQINFAAKAKKREDEVNQITLNKINQDSHNINEDIDHEGKDNDITKELEINNNNLNIVGVTKVQVKNEKFSLRKKVEELKEMHLIIEVLQDSIINLTQSLKIEKDKLTKKQENLVFRKGIVFELNEKFKQIVNDFSLIKDEYYSTIKKKNILKTMIDLTCTIPEINDIMNNKQIISEFYNLVFSHVSIFYFSNQSLEHKGKITMSFKISKNILLHDLKYQACLYLGLEDKLNDFILCDNYCFYMYYEFMTVNDYLSNYSTNSNCFYLIEMDEYKSNSGFSMSQIAGLERLNTKINFSSQEGERNIDISDIAGKITQRFYFNEYPLLVPYKRYEFNSDFKSSNLSIFNSALVMILVFIQFILTLYGIYLNRDIGRTATRISYFREMNNNKMIYTHEDLFKFIVQKLGYKYLSLFSQNTTNVNLEQIAEILDYPEGLAEKNISKFYNHISLSHKTPIDNFMVASSIRIKIV